MDLQYNAWQTLKDIYSFDEISEMPIRDLLELLRYFTPKIKELQSARTEKALENAINGKDAGGPLSG